MNTVHLPRVGFLSLLLHRVHPTLSLLLRLLRFSSHIHPWTSVKNIVLLALVAAGREVRVLLADDDADDRDFFTDAVTEVASNVKVETVTNGEELIKRLLKGSLPHIIFLDLNMPIKDGHECLEEIRAHEKLRHIPIVIYSTSSSREHIDESYAGGASLYVRKPDSYSDLKTIAKKILAFDWDNYKQPTKENFYFTVKAS